MIEFGCRDRDSMGKVSGDLGISAMNQNFEIILKFNFSEQFIRVNFSDVTSLAMTNQNLISTTQHKMNRIVIKMTIPSKTKN